LASHAFISYLAHNDEEFLKNKSRDIFVLLIELASYFLIKSDFIKTFY